MMHIVKQQHGRKEGARKLITISLCMIVKNEEDVLARCLDSVQHLVDEIVIVDTGSTDRTKEIARSYTARVIDFPWSDDFSAARNFSFSHAAMDYIFWLDADDILPAEEQTKFLTLKHTLSSDIDSVTMIYSLAQDEDGKTISSVRRNRLIKRANRFRWHGVVYEYLEVWGTILNSDITIIHQPTHHASDRNLKIYERQLAQGIELSPRDLFYFANELFDHQQYEQAIQYYEQFLQTKKGWVEDCIAACGKVADGFDALGDEEQALRYAFRSFEYDTPRAECCCRLGYYFLQRKQYRLAAFWYHLATQLTMPSDSWGFVHHACWTWLPHLQLCVCHFYMGEYELAYQHNEKAKQYVPQHPAVLHNECLLQSILAAESTFHQADES
ncbi:glycosyltransferase [Anoxybacillus geothermalis]|nr:glycosyltransferase [Anoxybacillus geothermalis]